MNHLIPTGSTPPKPQPMPLIPTGSTPSRPQPMPLIPTGSTPPRPPPMPPIPTGSTPPTPPPMPPFPRGYIPPPPMRMPPIPRGSRPPPPPPMPPRRNLPCLDLLQGHRENYIKYGIPLYKAALKGDWTAAKPILHKRPNLVRCAITEKHETLLHIAASAESTKDMSEFVTNLVYLMDYKDLELQNINYDTPMTLAAAVGNIKAAAIMVQKNPKLTKIPGYKKQMPLNMAANFAKPDMVRHLYKISNKMSGEGWDDENRGWVLQRCVEAEIFDVAIQILSDQPKLLLKKVLVTNVLIALARKTDAFKEKKPHFFLRIINLFSSVFQLKQHHEKETKAVQVLRIIWKNVATMHKKKINEIIQGPLLTHKGKPGYPLRVLFLAVKMRNVRFIVELIQLYPDLIWKQDDKGKTIFHLAAKRHQIMIYKMLHEIGSMKDFITPIKDINENNMLHMVAKSAKPERFRYGPGVAFQMQEELLWFKAVQQVIPPEQTQSLNKDGKTPQDLFTKKHLDMVKDGERWLRDTSNQCMVVATLITTIVFAAAFTLPGGYNQNTGIPFFRKEPSLIIFVIADAISLVSSSTSILMFLSILTSRYAEHEFLKLPNQLVNGIATLFVSIISMMVAFSASFFVLYDKKVTWVYFTITSLASIPVIIYVMLQYPLFRDVIKSYFRSRNLFRQNKPILYY